MAPPPPLGADGARRVVEDIAHEHWARITASLIGACGGDFQLAEDALQDALVVALKRWARDGVPERPDAWIFTTARRKAIDRLRRDQTLRRKREVLQGLLEAEQAAPLGRWQALIRPNDRFRRAAVHLFFMLNALN